MARRHSATIADRPPRAPISSRRQKRVTASLVGVLFEIPHNLLAILDGFARPERLMEKRRPIVFLLAGGDRGDNLVEIEVGEIGRRLRGLGVRDAFRR